MSTIRFALRHAAVAALLLAGPAYADQLVYVALPQPCHQSYSAPPSDWIDVSFAGIRTPRIGLSGIRIPCRIACEIPYQADKGRSGSAGSAIRRRRDTFR
jgi:hypothetical protein